MSLPDTISGYTLTADEGEAIWFNGALGLVKATAAQTQGRFASIEFRAPAGFGSPLHRHSDDDEFFVVLDGEVRFQLGDRVIDGETGILVYGPRSVPHAFMVDSQEARLLLLFGPAGVEGFFRRAGKPAPSISLPPADEQFLSRDELKSIAGEYGQEFLGPPLQPKS